MGGPPGPLVARPGTTTTRARLAPLGHAIKTEIGGLDSGAMSWKGMFTGKTKRWSVQTLVGRGNELERGQSVSTGRLHHLLRLSGLPLPRDGEEEARMKLDLKQQLQFVRHVQHVDTAGVEPLASLTEPRQLDYEGCLERGASLAGRKEEQRPAEQRQGDGVEDGRAADLLRLAQRREGFFYVVDR